MVGETAIMYFEFSTNSRVQKSLKAPTIFTAWERIDSQRYVLGDEYGRLYLLMLQYRRPGVVSGWKLDVLGETSKASVLSYLGNGNVFVGSHQGDSQVVAIQPHAIEAVQTFSNVAPILDFTIMDMANRSGEGQINDFSSGQARIVSGSGAFGDGSLRNFRSGVGLEDLGLLDQMENVVDMFGLKTNPSSQYVDILAVTFIDETRIFHFSSDGDIEELADFGGLNLQDETLFSSNVANGRILQVTKSCVRLTDPDSGMASASWQPPANQTITTTSANEDVVLIAVGGSRLVALDVQSCSLNELGSRNFDRETQIACLNAPVIGGQYCTVGFWQTSAVSVLKVQDLQTVFTENISDKDVTVPRDLLLANVLEGQQPTLFIAMADGTVVTYFFDPSSGTLSGKKSIVLGIEQASFKALPRSDNLSNIFAISEHPSLIYGSEGRLTFSSIIAEDASCVCTFNAEAYPGAIAIATKQDLKIALVDEERSTHVQSKHVGETVRRIAHSSELKAFALGTISRALIDNAELVTSHFRLVDEVTFSEVASYELNPDELVESLIRCKLPDGYGNLVERFVVGTAFVDDENTDSVKGRLIVLEVTEDNSLRIICEFNTRGACRCLGIARDKIVAALIKTVVVLSFEYETPSSPFLTKCASYRTSTVPVGLAITNEDTIAVADLMKSVSVLRYRRGREGKPDSLTEIARHFSTIWATAVALVDEDTYLESDHEGNLLVLKQDVKGVTEEDRRRLTVTSEIFLGDQVNKIQRIDVPTITDSAVVPRAFLATVILFLPVCHLQCCMLTVMLLLQTEGSIHLFALITSRYQDILMRLQSGLAPLIQSPGHIPFESYRAYRNDVRQESEPYRFVDGELIEKFLDLNETAQGEVIHESGVILDGGVEEVRGVVEALKRLR